MFILSIYASMHILDFFVATMYEIEKLVFFFFFFFILVLHSLHTYHIKHNGTIFQLSKECFPYQFPHSNKRDVTVIGFN